jgi:hypothetical protein
MLPFYAEDVRQPLKFVPVDVSQSTKRPHLCEPPAQRIIRGYWTLIFLHTFHGAGAKQRAERQHLKGGSQGADRQHFTCSIERVQVSIRESGINLGPLWRVEGRWFGG